MLEFDEIRAGWHGKGRLLQSLLQDLVNRRWMKISYTNCLLLVMILSCIEMVPSSAFQREVDGVAEVPSNQCHSLFSLMAARDGHGS